MSDQPADTPEDAVEDLEVTDDDAESVKGGVTKHISNVKYED